MMRLVLKYENFPFKYSLLVLAKDVNYLQKLCPLQRSPQITITRSREPQQANYQPFPEYLFQSSN
jgi:hypothetical protein